MATFEAAVKSVHKLLAEVQQKKATVNVQPVLLDQRLREQRLIRKESKTDNIVLGLELTKYPSNNWRGEASNTVAYS